MEPTEAVPVPEMRQQYGLVVWNMYCSPFLISSCRVTCFQNPDSTHHAHHLQSGTSRALASMIVSFSHCRSAP